MSIVSFGGPDRLETQMNRLFNDFFRDFNAGRVSDVGARWRPLIDVHESDKEYTVKAELPVSIITPTDKYLISAVIIILTLGI